MTHTRNSCSTFTHPSAHTQHWTHTNREHTHGAVGSRLCCGAQGAVGGSVSCSRAPRRGIEGGESAVHSLPPPTIPAGPRLDLATFQLWVWLSTIRPRLPATSVGSAWKCSQKFSISINKSSFHVWITNSSTALQKITFILFVWRTFWYYKEPFSSIKNLLCNVKVLWMLNVLHLTISANKKTLFLRVCLSTLNRAEVSCLKSCSLPISLQNSSYPVWDSVSHFPLKAMVWALIVE